MYIITLFPGITIAVAVKAAAAVVAVLIAIVQNIKPLRFTSIK